jgi:hypothetical protein
MLPQQIVLNTRQASKLKVDPPRITSMLIVDPQWEMKANQRRKKIIWNLRSTKEEEDSRKRKKE